jgi:hypothetical protein
MGWTYATEWPTRFIGKAGLGSPAAAGAPTLTADVLSPSGERGSATALALQS